MADTKSGNDGELLRNELMSNIELRISKFELPGAVGSIFEIGCSTFDIA
jgi:hypothetical protein